MADGTWTCIRNICAMIVEMTEEELEAQEIEAYIFELHDRIAELENENLSLTKKLEQKNDMIHLLESCVLGTYQTDAPQSTGEDVVDADADPKDEDELDEEERKRLSYKRIENMLAKKGMFTHPRVVEKLMSSKWASKLENPTQS